MSTVAGPRRTHEWALWIVAFSCPLHAAEEYFTGWQEWARHSLGIVMPTSIFVFMNIVLAIAALSFARLGWRRPALALIVPTATLVNAIAFHIIPTIVERQVSPGIYSAAMLYVPFSSWALVGAARDGVPRRAIATGALGGIIVGFGVVVLARGVSG